MTPTWFCSVVSEGAVGTLRMSCWKEGLVTNSVHRYMAGGASLGLERKVGGVESFLGASLHLDLTWGTGFKFLPSINFLQFKKIEIQIPDLRPFLSYLFRVLSTWAGGILLKLTIVADGSQFFPSLCF